MALADNKAKIQALLAGINALPEAGSGEPVLQEKSATPTKAEQSITPDTGYDGLSKVNVAAIPDEYIIPSGTVSITENGTHNVREAESVNVSVEAPDPVLQQKSVTPAKSAQTVTPDSGYDGLSAVNVEPIPGEYIVPNGALNIAENGTYDVSEYASAVVNVAGSGGGGELDDMLTNKLTVLSSTVTSIRQYAFRGATALTTINLPNATSIATNAFYGCSKLTTVNMPSVKTIAGDVFNACSILPSIVLPSLTTGGSYMFRYCYLLLTIDLPIITNIVANMFADCRRLTAVILRSEVKVCTLANTSAFGNCYHFTGTQNSTYNPNGLKDGYIYVPSSLLADYQAATNWSTYATQFRALEDYTVDGTITGALDASKV